MHTYCYLLEKTSDEDAGFTFSYFAKELIEEPDAVVRAFARKGTGKGGGARLTT